MLAARRQVSHLSETNARLSELADLHEREIERARYFAYHDELTGLPNRSLLLDRLNQVLAGAKRHDRQFALLFLDLDRFKEVNDRLGHSAGDKLLRRVAERLLSCVRGGDTACRYGGDEFVLLLPEVDSENGAAGCCRENPRPPGQTVRRRRAFDCADGDHRCRGLPRRWTGTCRPHQACGSRDVSREDQKRQIEVPPQDGRVALAAVVRSGHRARLAGHVRSGCGARSALFVPMRSYSAMTWAPSSSNVAPISRLRSTTMAVVSDP